MLVTKIAFTAVILMVTLGFVLVSFAEDVRPHNWSKLGHLDKTLVGVVITAFVACLVGIIAFIWGV
jgi:hypothetical protein